MGVLPFWCTMQWPDGFRVMVTGHRDIPPMVATLHSILSRIQKKHPEGVVAIGGMAQGADADFFDAAMELNIPCVAAVPIENHSWNWPKSDQMRHARQLQEAALVVNVWEDPKYNETSFAAKMHARNRWMLDHTLPEGMVLAVWDGRRKGGTWNTIRTAIERNHKVFVVNPTTHNIEVISCL